MPHFHIDYSANLEPDVDIAALCNRVRVAAIETGVFPMAGVRVRAIPCHHYSIADGDPKHAYLDVSIRLRGGRPQDAKEAATDHVFNALKDFLHPVLERRPLAISLEMRDIDPALSPKAGTIRDHLSAET